MVRQLHDLRLIAVCFELSENMHLLDKSLRLTKLRFEYFKYQSIDSAFKLFESMNELGAINRVITRLAEELYLKLTQASDKSLDYNIATEQFNYFTREWYEHLLPRLRETYQLATENKKLLLTQHDDHNKQAITKSDQNLAVYQLGSKLGDSLGDALLRLQLSVQENDRVIAVIAMNIEFTKNTIDAIHRSLEFTKLTLRDTNEDLEDALRATKSKHWRISCLVFASLLFILLALFVLARFFGLL